MTQNERVKEVRKTLGLTLEKFGDRLGIKKAAVSKIEKGENSLTDANIKAICREFSVDYMWLTTGEGEMFVETDDDFFERIYRFYIPLLERNGYNMHRQNEIHEYVVPPDHRFFQSL